MDTPFSSVSKSTSSVLPTQEARYSPLMRSARAWASAARRDLTAAVSWSGILGALRSAALGDVYFHLRVLYPLLGLYLVHPVPRRFTAAASRGEVLYFLLLCFLFASLLPAWTAFHPEGVVGALLERLQVHLVLGYAGYYVAGWYLRHYTIGRVPEFLLYLLGILGLVLTLGGDALLGGSCGTATPPPGWP